VNDSCAGEFLGQNPVAVLQALSLFFKVVILYFLFHVGAVDGPPIPLMTQLMDLGWKIMIPLALVNMLVTGFVLYCIRTIGISKFLFMKSLTNRVKKVERKPMTMWGEDVYPCDSQGNGHNFRAYVQKEAHDQLPGEDPPVQRVSVACMC